MVVFKKTVASDLDLVNPTLGHNHPASLGIHQEDQVDHSLKPEHPFPQVRE